MCLVCTSKRLYKCSHDLEVVKVLYKSSKGSLSTPITGHPVTPDKPFEASKGEPWTDGFPINGIYRADEGFIHCYTSPKSVDGTYKCEGSYHFYKAIIPAHTPFLISTDLREICARKIIVRDKELSKNGGMFPSFSKFLNNLVLPHGRNQIYTPDAIIDMDRWERTPPSYNGRYLIRYFTRIQATLRKMRKPLIETFPFETNLNISIYGAFSNKAPRYSLNVHRVTTGGK